MFIQFAASPGFMKKVDKARSLLSTRMSAGVSFEAVFEEAQDVFIAKHDPEARQTHRARRALAKLG